MLDFFQDIVLEVRGIDSEKERKEKKGKKCKDRFIFSESAKRIVFFFGILYFFVGGFQMSVLKGQKNIVFPVMKIIFLSALDIAALVCLLLRKKKAEVAALIFVIIFFVVMYTTTLIL
jgi:hypothetical protein